MNSNSCPICQCPQEKIDVGAYEYGYCPACGESDLHGIRNCPDCGSALACVSGSGGSLLCCPCGWFRLARVSYQTNCPDCGMGLDILVALDYSARFYWCRCGWSASWQKPAFLPAHGGGVILWKKYHEPQVIGFMDYIPYGMLKQSITYPLGYIDIHYYPDCSPHALQMAVDGFARAWGLLGA